MARRSTSLERTPWPRVMLTLLILACLAVCCVIVAIAFQTTRV